jgi:hypothetical protein
VHTGGARGERDVDTIIYDDGHIVACAQRNGIGGYLKELFGLLKEDIGTDQYARTAYLGGVYAFFADLYDCDPASKSLRIL